jgi:hypothetical protein
MGTDEEFMVRFVRRMHTELLRARRPLERRLAAILKMRSLDRPGKRGDRFLREARSIHERLTLMKPWNISLDSMRRLWKQELKASRGRAR